jgi:uroporphyrinogen decarboxylase
MGAAELHAEFGLEPLRVRNVSGHMGPYPPLEPRVLHEDDQTRVFTDEYGRTVRDLKGRTTLPEWLACPVTDAASLRRFIDERYSLDRLEERFAAEWERRIAEAAASEDLVLVDGGCYYWTLRSIAGVAGASYLLHDAPTLVEGLFERYCAIVLEGLRRATERVEVDAIGFGEDIAYKNGPLMSPRMFRHLILPRYRRCMDLARHRGIDVTWYDSDGDLRPLLPDLLSVGINCPAPCEVAAGMAPTVLRGTYGRELRLIGGLDKREIARGKPAIQAELERNRAVIEEGGFMPAIDHSVSADISLDSYRYFLEALQEALQA